MTMGELSAADVAAVTRPNFGYSMGMGGFGNGFGFGGDWILGLIAIAAVFGGGFGGFGGFGGGGVGAAGLGLGLQAGFDTQSINSKLDGITNGLSNGFYRTAVDGLQAQNQLGRDLCTGFAAVNAGIAENRYSAKDCCCETQRAIEGVKYANAQNTCDIVNAIHAEGNATRDLITQNKIEALQTKITELTAANQSKDLAISQANQNAYLVNKINSQAVPAYAVQNPNCCHNTCNGCGYYAD